MREILDGDKLKSSADVADLILNEAHTVLTDGAGFGADGFLRLSYATSLENLKTAVEAIKECLPAENAE